MDKVDTKPLRVDGNLMSVLRVLYEYRKASWRRGESRQRKENK